jgi:DNA-binding response OmpR family regulator
MPQKLAFIISWDVNKANELKEFFEQNEWRVETESIDGGRAYKKLKELLPSAVIIDLGEKPSHGKETALALKDSKITKSLPIFFLNASEKYRQDLCYRIPDSKFFTEESLKDFIITQS